MPNKKSEKKLPQNRVFTTNRHIYYKENMRNNPFRYKRGKMEVESSGDNKHAARLAYINTVMYWLCRLVPIALIIYKALHGSG